MQHTLKKNDYSKIGGITLQLAINKLNYNLRTAYYDLSLSLKRMYSFLTNKVKSKKELIALFFYT